MDRLAEPVNLNNKSLEGDARLGPRSGRRRRRRPVRAGPLAPLHFGRQQGAARPGGAPRGAAWPGSRLLEGDGRAEKIKMCMSRACDRQPSWGPKGAPRRAGASIFCRRRRRAPSSGWRRRSARRPRLHCLSGRSTRSGPSGNKRAGRVFYVAPKVERVDPRRLSVGSPCRRLSRARPREIESCSQQHRGRKRLGQLTPAPLQPASHLI